ncbi:MAG: site-specific integrase [Acidobacteria bacterium]|nr:site-specific integrase [Acidobacteriota bacterium]
MARLKKHYGKWQVLYRDPTGRERSAGSFTLKADAQRARKKAEHEAEIGAWIDPELRSLPLSDWSEQWMITRSGLKPKTLEGYDSLLRSRVLPMFGAVRLRDLRTIDIEAWIAAMVSEGLSASRVRQAHQVLSAVLKSAVRSRMIMSNPAEGVSLPKAQLREMLFLTPEEVERLAEAINPLYRTWAYLLAYGGLRWGEAVALRRSRINILKSRVTIDSSATEVRGVIEFGDTKSRRARTVVVPSFLRDMLDEHLAEHVLADPHALVFTGPTGSVLRPKYFHTRIWPMALVAAGLPSGLRIHDLRHTCAAMLISQGAHPEAIKRHLGHSSISVTMDQYGHLLPSENEHLADALDRVAATARAAT